MPSPTEGSTISACKPPLYAHSVTNMIRSICVSGNVTTYEEWKPCELRTVRLPCFFVQGLPLPVAEEEEEQQFVLSPPAPAQLSEEDQHKAALRAFFSVYRPENVGKVDQLYSMAGPAIWTSLEAKYPGSTAQYTAVRLLFVFTWL